MPEMKVVIDHQLLLKVEGIGSGGPATITVTDKKGNPVENAEIYLFDYSQPLWKTNAKGQVVTNLIEPLVEEGPVPIRAKKGELTSRKIVLGQL